MRGIRDLESPSIMCTVAAAPLLLDDPPIASPELALVDADLAARLRGDLSTGDAFRPHPVPRPEHPSLTFGAVVLELPGERPTVDEREVAPVSDVDELPDYIVVDDDDVADDAHSSSDYPVLPDLDERSDALEETEAALRRIREQLGDATIARRKPRVRRRFTVGAALCAVAALAVYAADVQLGVANAPGWLVF